MFEGQIMDLYAATVAESNRRMPFDAASRAAFEGWQARARPKLVEILGEMPRERCALRAERAVVEETRRYTRERVVYWTRPGLQVPAHLLIPKGVKLPAPAVLCLHGHSAGGKDETIDPSSIYRGFAVSLAERGLVALCPDQIPFGERRISGDGMYMMVTHGLNMLGHTLIGVRYWDLVRALDFLESLDCVRPDRIGAMGLSLGGEMTLFLSALDSRVRAACVCGYVTSHRNTFLARPHCTCGCLRDLARWFEHADLAALIAPRPLFLDSGRADTAFPTADAEAVIRELRPVYDLFGRPAAELGIEVHDGGHEIAGHLSIPWMAERLGAARGGTNESKP